MALVHLFEKLREMMAVKERPSIARSVELRLLTKSMVKTKRFHKFIEISLFSGCAKNGVVSPMERRAFVIIALSGIKCSPNCLATFNVACFNNVA